MIVGSPRRVLGASLTMPLKAVAAAALCLAAATGPARADTTVTLDPDSRFQTFNGWETTVNLFFGRTPERYGPVIFDKLLREVGISRLRLEIAAGAENEGGWIDDLLAGRTSVDDQRPTFYETLNDNDDPFLADPAGFDFGVLDYKYETFVLPMMERAKALGLPMTVTLCYVSFTKFIREGGPYIHDQPEEYAEFIDQVFLHLRDKYGFVPAALEVNLEPDMSPEWTPQKLGLAMAAVTRRLKADGFTMPLIAPSVTNASNAGPWMDGIAAVPGATEMMTELSYHRYKGGSRAVVREIANRAATAGWRTGMLEFWGGRGTPAILMEDLTIGNVSAWQGRAMLGFYKIDPSMPEGQDMTMFDDVRMNLPFFQTIRPGAVRIGAVSSAPGAVRAVAFRNPGDKVSVVVLSDAAEAITFHALPPGRYRVLQAYADESFAPTDPVTAGPDGTLTVRMLAAGVIAVTALAAN
jgi:Glycosyl hydrolase family 30 beta sandwich domain